MLCRIGKKHWDRVSLSEYNYLRYIKTHTNKNHHFEEGKTHTNPMFSSQSLMFIVLTVIL